MSSSAKDCSDGMSSLPELIKLRRTPTRINGRTNTEWSILQRITPPMREQTRERVLTFERNSGSSSPARAAASTMAALREFIASGTARVMR